MTDKKPVIPSVEEKRQALDMLKASNQQLELTAVALDELIIMVETGLSRQHHQRPEKSGRTASSSSTS